MRLRPVKSDDRRKRYAVRALAGLVVAGGGVVAARTIPPAWIPACGLHQGAGWPCPTCGLYRGLYGISMGDWEAAWRAAPILCMLAAGAAGWALYALAAWTFRWPHVRLELSRREKGVAACLVALALAGHWLYLVMAGI